MKDSLEPPTDEGDAPTDAVRPSEIQVDQHPIVAAAVEALKAFGGDLERESAAMLLPFWRHWWELSEREIAAILDRFEQGDPQAPPVTGRAVRGGGRISGPSTVARDA